jgi:predicted metallopeptidase
MSKKDPFKQQPNEESIFYTTRVTVRITEKPRATARLYRGNTHIQQEVLTTGLVLHEKGGDLYPIRFVHNRVVASALQIRPGDIIEVTQGRFKESLGRREMELHVKRFHRPSDAPPV